MSTETIHATSGADALDAWLARTRPRGQVTVAVVSPSQRATELALTSSVPPDVVRRHAESRLQALPSGDADPVAVAAKVSGNDGGTMTAHVAAVPASAMEHLWRAERPNVRYTVPAMAYTLAGVHLLVTTSATELLLVGPGDSGGGSPPVLEDAVVLAVGGLALDAGEVARRAHADSTAEEVERTIDSWRRRGRAGSSDAIRVSGAAAPMGELFDALRLRGLRPEIDLITERIDQTILGASATPPATLLATALPAAAAVCEPGPLGFLAPPRLPVTRSGSTLGRAGRQPVVRSRSIAVVPLKARVRRLAAPIAAIAAGGVLMAAVAGIVPAVLGTRSLHAARVDQARAIAQRAVYGADLSLHTFDRSLGAAMQALGGTPWGTVVPAIAATTPPGMTVLTLDLVDRGAVLAVTVTATAVTDAVVPSWLARLRSLHLEPSTSGMTVDRSGMATFTTTFDLAKGFR